MLGFGARLADCSRWRFSSSNRALAALVTLGFRIVVLPLVLVLLLAVVPPLPLAPPLADPPLPLPRPRLTVPSALCVLISG